jgi:ribosomal protein S18 acetylase RimI-like enzyme
MAVKPLRRLTPIAGAGLRDRMVSQTFHSVYWERYMEAAQSLLVEDDGNLLAALGRGGARLVYGFRSDRAFVDRFPAMFDELLPRLRRDLAAETVRFRLEHAPSRALVEPVLKRHWFTPVRDWIEFALDRDVKLSSAAAPRGVRVRDGGVDDAEEMVRIDRAAFPDTPILLDDMRARLADEQLLVATRGSEMAGFCLFWQPDPGEGYISVLAVDEAHRGQGIGALLTVRACKRLFGEGARRVRLTTDDSNGDAIRLYVRLGFKQSAAGRDYTRPTDQRVIEQMQARRRHRHPVWRLALTWLSRQGWGAAAPGFRTPGSASKPAPMTAASRPSLSPAAFVRPNAPSRLCERWMVPRSLSGVATTTCVPTKTRLDPAG